MYSILNKKVTYRFDGEIGEGILIEFGITYHSAYNIVKHETSGIIVKANGSIVNIPIRCVTLVDTSFMKLQNSSKQDIPPPPAPPQPQSRFQPW